MTEMLAPISGFAQQQSEKARQAAQAHQWDIAILHLQMALDDAPQAPELHFFLIECLLASQQASACLEHLNHHHESLQSHVEFYFFQGQAYQHTDNLTAALRAYQQGAQLFPEHLATQLALASLYRKQNQASHALYHYQMAVRLAPEDSDLHLELAHFLAETHHLSEAQELYLKIYSSHPQRSDALLYWLQSHHLRQPNEILNALIALAHKLPHLKTPLALHAFSVLYTVGEAEEARRNLELALQDTELSHRSAYEWLKLFVTAQIPADAQQLSQYQRHLAACLKQPELPDKALIYNDYSNLQPYLQAWEPLSYLPYFNIDPKLPRVQFAKWFQRCLPALPANDKKVANKTAPKIGLLINNSSAMACFWISTLLHWPDSQLSLLYLPPATLQSQLAHYRTDLSHVILPSHPEEQLQWLQQAQFDLLFFTEVLKEPLNQTFLAAHRLAPVQVTSILSSGTSGLNTLDYFISSKQLEQEQQPERFYSETLICLEEIPAFLPLSVSLLEQPARSEYGLPEQGRLYVCPHHLFKLHPDFDSVLAAILQQDRTGHLVLQNRPDVGTQSFYTQWLKRFERLYPELLSRIWCLPWISPSDFLGLLQIADVLLDPFYVGGRSTTLEAFSLGIPLITWPGERASGRLAYALYQAMGLLDCVAYNPQDYVQKALEIAQNPDYRAHIHQAMLAAQPQIFEQQTAVNELASCLKNLIQPHP